MSISQKLAKTQSSLPKTVSLVAVSKTKPIEAILEAYKAGQRIFGENKAQELARKFKLLPQDIEWHMIGHLQSNKVKYIASFVTLIHGVDSWKLLLEINKRAAQNKRVIDCLLQMHIAQETTKFGLNESEIEAILKKEAKLENIRIVGLMGMASFTSEKTQIREEFSQLKKSFNKLQKEYPNLENLSMGMSGDYSIAIEEGSSMVRIGSAIFGSRN